MRRPCALSGLAGLLIAGSPLPAQVGNQMRPTVPSPTAASLGKFGDIPVSHFSGVPQITIPLFTAKGKTLDLPIALSYHASGIKVEEIGGWVGAGWTLEAGGAITRTVRGIVDEQYEGYFNTGHTFYNPQNWTYPPPVTLVQNIRDMQTVDGEPDQFFFNFAGYSGEFVGGDTTATQSDPNVYVTIPYQKWRIEPRLGTDPFWGMLIIREWVITTENGTRYTFGAPEVHVDASKPWLGDGRTSKPYVSAWYLTSIRAPGGDSITLTYADYAAEHHTGMYREETNDMYQANPGDCGNPGYQVGSSFILDIHSQTYIRGKRLQSISSAAHTITFTTSLREDARSPYYGDWITHRAQQESKLDAITVATADDVVLRRFEFEYTYDGPLGGRLTLLNVYETDPNGTRLPPYSFTYDGPTLPARVTDRTDYHDPSRTASFALDHWGYYNGATGNTTLIPPGTSGFATQNSYPGGNREPNFNYMKGGSLIKIVYPTGGFNEFVYEANDYSSGASMVQDTPINYNASAVSSPGDVAPQTRDFTIGGIDLTVEATVSVYISEPCSPSPCVAELWQGSTRINAWSTNLTSQPIQDLAQGTTYTIKVWNQGTPNVRVAVTIYWQERITVVKKTGAGLRIAQVRTDDGMGNVMVRKYSYQLDDGRSSGWVTLGPRYDYNRQVISADNSKQCSYYSRSSTPRTHLGSGPVVEYTVVTESLGVNGEFGKTVRRFNAGCDCAEAAIAANENKEWPFLRYTTATWRRGNPTGTHEYNAAGQPQQSTAFTYSTPPAPHPLITFRGLAVDVYSMWSGSGTNTYFIYANQFLVQTSLKVETARAITIYDETGTSSIVTTQTQSYGNPAHAQMTERVEVNSGGTQRVTRLKYPGDYASGGSAGTEAGALAAMQDVSPAGAHMPGVVIERSVAERIGGADRIVQAEVTTFKEFLAGQFLPYKRYVLNSPSPIP